MIIQAISLNQFFTLRHLSTHFFLLHDSSSITKNLEKSEKFKIFSRLGLRKFSRKSDKKEWRGDKYSEPSGQSVFNGVL